MKALLIAEKPSLMKELQSIYRKHGYKDEIEFLSFSGHTMSLCEPKIYKEEWEKWNLSTLPMIPEKFKYKPTSGKAHLYQSLKKAVESGQYDYIINACDAGREGQHIFFSFYESLNTKLPVKRIWILDLTESGLKKAFESITDDDTGWLKSMKIASKYRAYFDWLVGLNSTRAVSIMAGEKINIGRVMTPTLKIISDRELELKSFKSKDYWEIEALFKSKDGEYKGILFEDEKGGKHLDKSVAEKKIEGLSKESKVIKVDKKRVVKNAPQLHSLQELSNEANRVYGYTMAETLEIAQTLYEKKITSYPRTNSKHITEDMTKDLPKLLDTVTCFSELKADALTASKNTEAIEKISKSKRYVDNSKVQDHYALIPTGVSVKVESLSPREKNVLFLVCRRFLSIFLPPLIIDKTEVITESNGYTFQSKGSCLVDLGFARHFDYKSEDVVLPNIEEGEFVELSEPNLLEKKTTHPARYTDETLGKAMENAGRFVEDKELSTVLKESEGLGTPATRGAIVEKLVALKMIERKKKAFYSTDFGLAVMKLLDGKEIALPDLTARWESKLVGIESGEYSPEEFYSEMIEYTKSIVADFKKLDTSQHKKLKEEKESLGKCPKCGSDVIEGKSYYLCKEYKNSCDFIFNKEIWGAKISKTEAKKILAGKESKEFTFTWKSGKKSKDKLKIDKTHRVKPLFMAEK